MPLSAFLLCIRVDRPLALTSSWKVLRVNVDGEATGHSLHDVGDTLGLDFWSELRVNAPVDVMVSPQNLDRLTFALGVYVCFLSKGGAFPYFMNQLESHSVFFVDYEMKIHLCENNLSL